VCNRLPRVIAAHPGAASRINLAVDFAQYSVAGATGNFKGQKSLARSQPYRFLIKPLL
jgi:hypothetical protein